MSPLPMFELFSIDMLYLDNYQTQLVLLLMQLAMAKP